MAKKRKVASKVATKTAKTTRKTTRKTKKKVATRSRAAKKVPAVAESTEDPRTSSFSEPCIGGKEPKSSESESRGTLASPGNSTSNSLAIANRIKEYKLIEAGAIRPHPQNWQTHGDEQRTALRKAFTEIGVVSACVVFEPSDGGYMLIDGHLRQEELAKDPTQLIPCLVLDVDDDEAKSILTVLDPIGAMSGIDTAKLKKLVADLDDDMQEFHDTIVSFKKSNKPKEDDKEESEPASDRIFQVVAECVDEGEQQSVYGMLTDAGYKCKVLTLD